MQPDLSDFLPCHESWDGMAPLDDGRRFCARCERPVTDLRGLSIAEISLVHAMSDEPVCGVYTPDQLRPDAPPEPPRRCRSPLVTLALGASLLAARAEAQAAAPVPREQVQLPPGATPETPPRSEEVRASAAREDTLVITGTVRDRDRSPIRAAVVFADGTPARTVTDIAGAFVLRVPGTGRREIQLRVARIGYETKTVALAVTGSRIDAAISLEEAMLQMMAGIVATAAPTAQDRDRMRQREEGFSVARIRLDNP